MEIARIPPLVTIRTLREVARLTSPQVVERMAEFGVDYKPTSLTNLERGCRGASREAIGAMANAYGISPVDIWDENRVIAHVQNLLNARNVA